MTWSLHCRYWYWTMRSWKPSALRERQLHNFANDLMETLNFLKDLQKFLPKLLIEGHWTSLYFHSLAPHLRECVFGKLQSSQNCIIVVLWVWVGHIPLSLFGVNDLIVLANVGRNNLISSKIRTFLHFRKNSGIPSDVCILKPFKFKNIQFVIVVYVKWRPSSKFNSITI